MEEFFFAGYNNVTATKKGSFYASFFFTYVFMHMLNRCNVKRFLNVVKSMLLKIILTM